MNNFYNTKYMVNTTLETIFSFKILHLFKYEKLTKGQINITKIKIND